MSAACRSALAPALDTGEEDRAARDRLLEAALPHLAAIGWSRAALQAGAVEADLGAPEVDRLFPGGIGDLLRWFDDWADRRMLAALDGLDLAKMKIRERVAAGVMARLGILAPHREAVRRALAHKFGPRGAMSAAETVLRTADRIWIAAGDTATDYNFYTKRGLLASAYAPTVLFWLNDDSPDMAETRAFLERRLGEILQIPKLQAQAKRAFGPLFAPFDRLRKGRN